MQDRHAPSIARRIQRRITFKLAASCLIFNILFAALFGGIFILHQEKSLLKDRWPVFMHRGIHFERKAGVLDTLDTVQYVFEPEPGSAQSIPLSGLLRSLLATIAALVLLQTLFLFSGQRRGRRETEKLLEPLNRMSRTAAELSQRNLHLNRYRTLESAIDALSPKMPGERLHTGDKELLGLETAVNNLIARMQENLNEQTRFVSDASHELRTPISVIQGYADMLARWGSKDETILNEGIEAIRTESKNMQTLVEQLLFLARGDAGRQKQTRAAVSLNDMMKDLFEEYEMIAADREFHLLEGQPATVMGDPALIKQAARILCDNAIKYSNPGGHITLRAFVNPDGQPAFSVQDDGQGINKSDLPHIFERFYRADPARARHSGGTGLGLSIAKWIVDSHGGYFNVVSREGLGTRIEVILPKPDEQENETASFVSK